MESNMKGLILLLAISLNVSASEYEIDFTISEVTNHWETGNADTATFSTTMQGIGLTKWWESGFGVRAAYQKGGIAKGEAGKYQHHTMNMESIESLEIMYRYDFGNSYKVYFGHGMYWIPLTITKPNGDFIPDRDDDTGFFLGITKVINKNFDVSARFTQYSAIDVPEYNLHEWTRGITLQLSYKFN